MMGYGFDPVWGSPNAPQGVWLAVCGLVCICVGVYAI